MNGFRISRRKQLSNNNLALWPDPADISESRRARILIIDENEDTHRSLRRSFANDFDQAEEHVDYQTPARQPALRSTPPQLCFELEHALNTNEALDKIKKSLASGKSFHVAFVGIHGSGIDDAATIGRVWEIDPSIQVVVVMDQRDGTSLSLHDRLDSADKLLLLKRPFEHLEVILLARTLTAKWFLGRQADQSVESQSAASQSYFFSQRQTRASSPSNTSTSQVGDPKPRNSRQKVYQRYGGKEDLPFLPGLSVSHADTLFLRRTIEVVGQHMSDCEFAVDALARMLFISRRQLLRRVKDLAGCAPNVLIRRLRLRKAAELLLHSGSTVSEITFAVGFSDLKHFREVFREQYGVCPADYARNGQEKTGVTQTPSTERVSEAPIAFII